jgi:hypothetical protein
MASNLSLEDVVSLPLPFDAAYTHFLDIEGLFARRFGWLGKEVGEIFEEAIAEDIFEI